MSGRGLSSDILKEAEKFAKENDASVMLTSAGNWNIDFIKKNGYLLRGELKDVPKGHNCYELYKIIDDEERRRENHEENNMLSCDCCYDNVSDIWSSR